MYVKEIRQKLQRKLADELHKFVVKIETDEIEIIEEKNRSAGQLQKVTIKGIPCDEYTIWRINLEHEVQGLSRIENRTVEIALAFIEKRKTDFLTVNLIELKSRIDDKYLAEIIKKLGDSISRFYFLLSLNDSNDHKAFPNLQIRFMGVVFYNGKEKLDKNHPSSEDKIHKNFKDKSQGQKSLLECGTLLGKYKTCP
jgi:hypothetical protein